MILFTGLTGKSGSALVEILKREHYSEPFRVVVRKTTDTSMLDKSGLNFEKVYGSVYKPEFMAKAMKGVHTVFHIAAKDAMSVVADAAIMAGDVKHIIFVSSTSIYSKHRKTESVRTGEAYCKKVLKENGIAWTFIRPTMIFGTLQDHNMSQFIRMVDHLQIFPIVKHGKAFLQPVYQKDLAEAYYLILTHLEMASMKTYDVSGEDPIALIDMFKLIEKKLGKKNLYINIPFGIANFCIHLAYYLSLKKVDYREKLYRLTEDRNFDHKLISEELGYSPKPFEVCCGELVNEYLKDKKRRNKRADQAIKYNA